MFHAGPTVGDLGEIIAAELLLLFEAERAMIRGDDLQVITAEAAVRFPADTFETVGGLVETLPMLLVLIASSTSAGCNSARAPLGVPAWLSHPVGKVTSSCR